MLMVGVWFGQCKPVMSTLLQPIVDDLLKLEREGNQLVHGLSCRNCYNYCHNYNLL